MSDPAVHASAPYATFTRRFRALVIDSGVVMAGLAAIVLSSELTRAAARFWIKAVLGLFSFVPMALTRRHQAVHDSLTRTTVQIRDLARAQPYEYLAERSAVESAGMPSAVLRIVVVAGYQVVLFLATLIGFAMLMSSACIEADRCTLGEEVAANILGLAWFGASAMCLIAGWRGRLWGARAGPEPPVPGAPDT